MAESWNDIVSPLIGSVNRSNRKRKNSDSVDSAEGRKEIMEKVIKKSMSETSDDIEAAPSSSADLHFTPSQIAKIVEELRTKAKQKKRNRSKRFLGFSDFDGIELPPGTTAEMLKSDLRRYLREATALSTMNVPMALELLHMFLEEGHSVTLDPTFPKKPPNGFQLFMRKTGQSKFSAEISALWRSNPAEKAAAKKEASQLMEKYLADLTMYRDTHKDLSRNHQDYLDNAIAIAQKSIEKTNGVKGTENERKAAGRKEGRNALAKTPFELFVLSMSGKYAEMEPEKREKKLLKKFLKLSEIERGIYESLAAAL